MKNKLFVCVVAALALVGCGVVESPEVTAAKKKKKNDDWFAENQYNITNAQFIASTPQGDLYRILIRPAVNEWRHDRIYFFDTNKPVSINTDVTSGKSTHTETIVIINGKEYVPKN